MNIKLILKKITVLDNVVFFHNKHKIKIEKSIFLKTSYWLYLDNIMLGNKSFTKKELKSQLELLKTKLENSKS